MKKLFVFVLCLSLSLLLIACAASPELEAANAAVEAIGTVTLESENSIIAAEEAFAKLTDKDLEKFKDEQTIIDARVSYEKLVAEIIEQKLTDKAAIVDELIAKIGTVTLDSNAAIEEARKAYDESENDVKGKIAELAILEEAEAAYQSLVEENAAKEAAAAADDLIAQIGEVTLDSKERIAFARDEYDKLNELAKEFVKNINTLEKAEETLDTLVAAEREKILSEMEKNFDIDYDKIQGITWYMPKAIPEYIDTRSYVLPYIGMDNSGNVWICIRYNYTADDLIFWTRMTIMIDRDKDYKFYNYRDITRDNDSEVWEYYDDALSYNEPITNTEIARLRKIAESEETIVRFEGDTYYYDLTIKESDKKAIAMVLDTYEALRKD